jgi:hypothetical protein
MKTFSTAEQLGVMAPKEATAKVDGEYIPWLFQAGLTPDEVRPAS